MRTSLAIAVVVAMVGPARAANHYRIADFEGADALRDWTAPGGMLSLGEGHRGTGALLRYPANGTAGAIWKPASPIPKFRNPEICLWLRVPPDAAVSVTVTDSSGQTRYFPIGARMENASTDAWQFAAISLSPAPRGRLVGAGIRVETRAGREGTVSFDDLELRESGAVLRIDADAETIQLPAFVPPLLGVNVHRIRDEHSLDLAHSAGFRFVRADLLWANVERGGRYRFVAYDGLLRALEARGMSVLWILDYGHPDHGGDPPRSPEGVAAFARFAEAAAEHFKGRQARYEIWNEPNIAHFWAPAPSPSEYALLLREAIAAIRRGDPAAPISSGGLARFDEAFLRRAIDRTAATGLTAIGVHPYPTSRPESAAVDVRTLRDWVASALGERLEIWDTEWGYSSASAPRLSVARQGTTNGHSEAGRRRQATLAVREMLTVWSVGLPLAIWYDLRDDGDDPANQEHNYGLLDAAGNEKPAMAAMRNFTGAAGVRKYAGMLAETPAGVHAMRFDGPDDRLLIVWNDEPGARSQVEYTRANVLSVTDCMGEAVKSKQLGSGAARIELQEAAGPIYLRLEK